MESHAEFAAQARRIVDEVERVIVGKRGVIELVLLAILADGHVLIEDLPGLAKTLLARSLASVLGLEFKRIQFTPDLMPSDVTGFSIYDQRAATFVFRPGPVFANVVLADEINRAPAKTQSALLEAMQERRVTIEGVSRDLPQPFIVIATQNPIEFEGTYPLPEAQLDRFLLRTTVGYPERTAEQEMLRRRADNRSDDIALTRVVSPEQLAAIRSAIEAIHVSPAIGAYIVDLVADTRSDPRVQVGASPRGSLALLKLSRSRALAAGRDFVVPEDVKAVAVAALAHRLILRPEFWVRRLQPAQVVLDALERVPTPPAVDLPQAAQ